MRDGEIEEGGIFRVVDVRAELPLRIEENGGERNPAGKFDLLFGRAQIADAGQETLAKGGRINNLRFGGDRAIEKARVLVQEDALRGFLRKSACGLFVDALRAEQVPGTATEQGEQDERKHQDLPADGRVTAGMHGRVRGFGFAARESSTSAAMTSPARTLGI